MALNSSQATIGYDTTFELNEFMQPRIRSEIELIRNTVLFILFAKPGQYPSLPMIGLDIQTMLYSFYDDINTEDLRDQIVNQCNAMGVYFDKSVINIVKTKYRNQPSLMIYIEGTEYYPQGYMHDSDADTGRYLIGISFDELKQMVYNIKSDWRG